MITVDTPASFEWTDASNRWVKNYLLPRRKELSSLIVPNSIDIETINEYQFTRLCQQLEQSAEGRELRNKMFKAWRSKMSRDRDNGKKLYTFNLSIKAGDQLKKIAKNTPLNKTLESLIFSNKIKSANDNTQELTELKIENQQLHQQLSENQLNSNVDVILNADVQVNELAKLEKSQLIKQILLLKRKLNQLPS